MAEEFPDFEIQEIQELKECSEMQNTKKSTSTWLNVWTSWAEYKDFETNSFTSISLQVMLLPMQIAFMTLCSDSPKQLN